MIIAIETQNTSPAFTARELVTDLDELAYDFAAEAEMQDSLGLPEQAARSNYLADVCCAVSKRVRDAMDRNDCIEYARCALKVSIEFFGDITAMKLVLTRAVNRHFRLKNIAIE